MHTIHQLTVLSACVALECRRSKKGKGEEGERCINHCVPGEHAIDQLGSMVIVGLVISVEFMFFSIVGTMEKWGMLLLVELQR